MVSAGPRSLRWRLFFSLIIPLVLVAALASAARYWEARELSNEMYDETLKVVAHAVSREVLLTQGNLIPAALRSSLINALGDPIYYQVRAGDGKFVTGYSDAPPPPADMPNIDDEPFFFDSIYSGEPVRSVMLREFTDNFDLTGWTTVQVWQNTTRRHDLSLLLAGQSAIGLLLMVGAAGLLFLWGINRGLRPLGDLRAAVAARSATDLRPIQRPVPPEVAVLVETINGLFGRLREELHRRDVFIGDAAHQLRNPVAAIQAQSEAALVARTVDSRDARLEDLSEAARHLSRVTHQLLHFDLARNAKGAEASPQHDFTALVAVVARRHVPRALKMGVDIAFEGSGQPAPVTGNAVMLEEAVDNLIDNGLKYGCGAGDTLKLTLSVSAQSVILDVSDTGPGIPPESAEQVFERFVQLSDRTDGSGLGLAIVRTIVERAGGTITVVPVTRGCTMRLALPLAPASARFAAADTK